MLKTQNTTKGSVNLTKKLSDFGQLRDYVSKYSVCCLVFQNIPNVKTRIEELRFDKDFNGKQSEFRGQKII